MVPSFRIDKHVILFIQDTNFSTAALNHLQGTILYSSPGGDGIRLEYPLRIHIQIFIPLYSSIPPAVFCLMRKLGMQNQGWECEGRRSNYTQKEGVIILHRFDLMAL